MDIEFVWSSPTRTVPRDVLESKIREDIEGDPSTIRPCHPGAITVHLSSTNPVELTITGKVVCQCDKSLATFSGASDGSGLHWYQP